MFLVKILAIILVVNASSALSVELTVEEATRLYFAKNLELMATKFEIDLARADELTAALWANPSLLLDSQLNPFGKNWNQKTSGGPAQQDYILTFPLDLNGKRRQAVRVASIATKIAETQFQSFVRERIFDLLGRLYNLQRLKDQHGLLLEKSQLHERLVLTLQKRFGNTQNQPLVQARARLANENVKLEIESNKIEQESELQNIRTILLLPNEETVSPKVIFRKSTKETFNLERLTETAKVLRPDFRAIGLLKTQIDGQLELEKRRIWDDVGLQAGLSRQDKVGARPNDPGGMSFQGAWSWMVGLTLPLPLFDRNQGTILQTKLRANQVLTREKFMNDALVKEIGASIKKIQLTNDVLHRYEKEHLETTRIVRDSALRQFGTGAMTLLEYLDAMEAYHSTIDKYIETQFNLTMEHLKLKLASGQDIRP